MVDQAKGIIDTHHETACLTFCRYRSFQDLWGHLIKSEFESKYILRWIPPHTEHVSCGNDELLISRSASTSAFFISTTDLVELPLLKELAFLEGVFCFVDAAGSTSISSLRNASCPKYVFAFAPVLDGLPSFLYSMRDGSLPHYRLAAYQRPFTFTGLDAFGPFTVTVGRQHEKRWVIIFTCLVTRAIHLEVVQALSTDEFIMGLSRFIFSSPSPFFITRYSPGIKSILELSE
ncbi:hypothetical protein LAZ67_4003638 [Cordylochernes scorpioides]|uniref:Uncharacterized protein n=1 Tax=Cordylochernes scorpioides TaxID=51811 RepID=A0ABY6KFM7_9ARAC|nr:hypothetical protein LAZ67_4003638 [Cordylochernes scorpioides]